MMTLILALLGSYLIGSFPTGFLLVKWLKRVDLRTVGSGNIGATNVGRVAGKGASAAVFLLDAAKGAVPVLLIAPQVLEVPGPTAALACGLAAVLGHNFPVFLRFKGGKGVATTIGVLVASMPGIAAVYLLTWGFCVVLWRYVSVASMVAALVIPLGQSLTHQSAAELLLGTALAFLIIARHHANIQRLLQGRELRIGQRHESQLHKR